MNNLRDQLLKAGLVGEEDVKRVERQKRAEERSKELKAARIKKETAEAKSTRELRDGLKQMGVANDIIEAALDAHRQGKTLDLSAVTNKRIDRAMERLKEGPLFS